MKKIFSLLTIVGCLFAINGHVNALTYTVTVPAGTPTCYIAGNMNGWSPSANRMTKVEGANQFTIDLPNAKETDEYKYCCGPDWGYVEKDAAGEEIGNRTWTASDVVATWEKNFVMDERTVTIEVLVPKEVLELYLVGNFNNWSSDFKNSPYKMNYVGDEPDGKVFTVNVTYIDVIHMEFKFVAGPDWSYEQTESANYVYGTTENIAFFDVKSFKAIFDPTKAGDITITATVPAGTNRVWIQGSFAGWNWDNPGPLEMTRQTNGTFTYTVANVEMFEYRLYNSPDWGHPEVGEADPTAELANRKAAFTEGTNVTISVWGWMQEVNTLTYTVTVPEGTQACFIAGQMNDWSPTKNRMTKVEGTNQFTIDFLDAKVTDEYKYCCGPDWGYVEKGATGEEIGNRTWTASDVVATWAKSFVPDERTVTIEVLVPKEVQVVYIVGNFNSWSGDFKNSPYKMEYVGEEDDGNVFTIDVTYIDVIHMEFKFVAGPDWSYEQTASENYVYNSTDDVAFYDVKSFKAIFDPEKAGDITITATVPAGTNRVWIQGSFAGWNWDNPDPLEMTKQANGTFTYTVELVEMFEYRLYNSPDWNHPEVGEADPAVELPNRKAVFADTEDGNIEIAIWGWMQEVNAIPRMVNDNFNIYPLAGQIIVEGVFSRVDIYNLAGKLVQSAKASSAFTSEPLNTGLYIVRVDGVSKKLLVK